jgi:hypothetical protein
MPPQDVWRWVEQTAIATAVREGSWLYPAVETVHILGVATLFGSISLLDLRLLGVSRALPLEPLARHALAVVRAAFAVQVASGSLLFAANAAALMVNPAFRTKMVLVVLGALNALLFHLGPMGHLLGAHGVASPGEGAGAGAGLPVPVATKAMAAVSLCLWTAVVVLGRLIAYV